MERRILLVGGGSGGHIYPLVAVANSLREKAAIAGIELNLLLLGDSPFLRKAARENKIPYKTIVAGKLRRYLSFESFLDLFKIPIGFFQSFWHVFIFMPDAVFVKGGYASVAPAIIAKFFFIPVYMHETDSVPGMANVIIGRFADTVFLSYKIAEKSFEGTKVIFTGNPVRKNLFYGDENRARDFFHLREDRPALLIIGGSQGAKALNDVILSSIIMLCQKYNVIHICGERQYEEVKKNVDTILTESTSQYSAPVKVYYRLYPYLDENELSLAYALADIIVCRAGGLLFEIAQLGKPAIVVPIQNSAGNHQYLNAYEFSLYGGYLIEEVNFNRESMTRAVEHLLNPENYAKVSEKIKTFAAPDAADKIAAEILNV